MEVCSRNNHSTELIWRRRKMIKSISKASSKAYQCTAMDQQTQVISRNRYPQPSLIEERASKVVTCLHQFGMAVIDNLLGEMTALRIRSQVE